MDSSMIRLSSKRCLILFVLTAGVGWPCSQARAEEPAAPAPESPPAKSDDPNLELARDAFRLGSTLARQGQWRDALAAYERSAELRPHAVTTYNIGYVERALGHLTRARHFLGRAVESGTDTGLEPLPENLQALARAYLVEIDRKIARVSVTLDDPRIAVSIDGRPLEVLSSGERPLLSADLAAPGLPAAPPAASFDLLIDPGRHVILVSLPGRGERVQNQSFEPGSGTSLRLAVEENPSPPPPPAPIATRAAPRVQERADLRPWMWTAFAAGAVGVVAGSVFGILAIDKEAELARLCPVKNRCPHQAEQDTLDGYATGANIGFGVGLAGVAVGTALWLLDRPANQETTPAARATTRFGVTQSGVWIESSF
jgi:hypothetical protein